MRLNLPKSKLLRSAALSCRRIICDEQGATAIEYALIAAGITVAIATTVSLVGSKTNALFASVAALFP